IVWASNIRLGLADAFDQYLIPSRRFFTGGGNSIRGFRRDLVGPIDPFFNDAVGGEALFVMNQELRVPLFKWMDGVVFYDTGNVYLNLEDFSLRQLRHGAGFGLRLNTPVAFLRLDYGFNLFPKEGEARSVFYFTIGQVF
ncbi:MAG: BamA/TamA family outer membrane protein, partial [Candidatus Aminicenantes bacterium]|nr:BamA/TamA family outer membrane protein [Candidatus Aminicenantes bacterium]